jgi:uncharacterized protein (DUF885 family)
MSRRRTIVTRTALVVLLAAAVFAVPEAVGKPWFIHHFYMRVLVEQIWESPQLCSTLHMLDWRNDKLDDASPEALKKHLALVGRQLATLHRYDRASMSAEEQTSYDVMQWFLTEETKKDTNGSPYLINQMDGEHTSFPQFMIQEHDLKSKKDADDYVARLRALGTKVDQIIASAKQDAARGVVPPLFVLKRVEKDTNDFAARSSAENPLVANVRKKVALIRELDDATRSDFVAEATRAIDEVVKPAYARYAAEVVDLEKNATDDGLWHQPGGAARYAYYLRQGTASDLTPDEVHAMGLAEVTKLEAAMRVVIAKVNGGPATEEAIASPTDAVRAFQKEERFHYPATKEGRTQTLADYQTILDDIGGKLDRFIATPFKTPMKVEPVPDFQEASAAGGHYEAPPLDESRPGVFAVNLAVPQIKFEMRTLAYHEGMPGHHLQIMSARHVKELPMFRQLIPFNSYEEGWALWAEQIAATNGFEDDPFDQLGYLSAQIFRASRLVVDTGIHAKQWSRDQAVAFFQAHTTASPEDIDIEINRYFVWPGQACGYMVGKKTIERLAEKAKGELGDKFTLPEFDTAVLNAGAMPMPVLETVIDRWIASKRK